MMLSEGRLGSGLTTPQASFTFRVCKRRIERGFAGCGGRGDPDGVFFAGEGFANEEWKEALPEVVVE